MTKRERIIQYAKHQEPVYRQIALDIHARPEVSNYEFYACARLSEQMKAEGFEVKVDVAGHRTGFTACYHLDIADDGGFKIVPVQADTVPAQLKNGDEGTLAVINGNYALEAGYTSADALALEDASGDAAQYYANLIGVREGEEESEKTKALVKAILTDDVKQFIEETYNGSVVAIW